MTMTSPTDLVTAFDILLESIEVESLKVTDAVATALTARDFDRARKDIEHGEFLNSLHGKVEELRAGWENRSKPIVRSSDRVRSPRKRVAGKPTSVTRVVGIRTPESEYRLPILAILEEMGGEGEIGEMLDRVGAMMNEKLNNFDRQTLPSSPTVPRWRNAAHWTKNNLANEGFISRGAVRQHWVLTESGRRYLAGLRKEQG